MTELEQAEQEYAAARVKERVAEWKAMEAKAVYYRYASEAMEATAEVMGADLRRKNAVAAEFTAKAFSLEAKGSGPTGGDDGGTISLDRSDLTGHPNAPDESGSSAARFDLDSLSPEERQEMIDRAVGDEAEQQRAVQAFEEQEGEDFASVRDRAGEVDAQPVSQFDAWLSWESPPALAIGTQVEIVGAYGPPRQWVVGVETMPFIPTAYRLIEPAGGYAPVTDEPVSVLDNPDLQARAEEMRATLTAERQAGVLVSAELDADLKRIREREGQEESKPWFGGIFGGHKLVGAQ